MTSLITISGAYGAGGSHIGRELAERLHVPFLDRAIPARVAEELAVPLEEATQYDERVPTSWPERMLRSFIAPEAGAQTWLAGETITSVDFNRTAEKILLEQAASGKGVILGRAAMIVLRNQPNVLRVRLDGPLQARVQRAMALEDIDERTAEQRLHQTDKAHAAYVGHFYGADLYDCSLYDIVLDATALSYEDCVELLLHAASLPVRASAVEA
ncbi:MAG TPA: cytidylate kinase-like family protein [Solirubrobacteraceae bacterium]|jgi:cytidylate kinase